MSPCITRACLLAVVAGASLVERAQAQTPTDDVARVLDKFHQAAADADFAAYFSLFAAESVFLGTDASERWDRDQFMAFAKPFFDQGRGWRYTPLERHVTIAPGGATAWFDERLENADLGECRGSGVLILEDGSWKVAQYNLTIPVPNELANEFVARIRAYGAKPAKGEKDGP